MKEYYKVGNSIREKTIDEDTDKVLDDRLICVVRNTEDEEDLTNRICRALQVDYNAEMMTKKVQRSKSIDAAISAAKECLFGVTSNHPKSMESIRKCEQHLEDVQRCLKRFDIQEEE